MKISYQWLNDYIDIADLTPQQLGDKLTEAGIPVEVFTELNQGITGVVVGHVLETRQHENADKLRVCTIDAGTGENLQIVCGAPNVAPGQKVPCAVVGSELPGDFKIKKAKLRGVESQGMLCSAKELGMDIKLLPKEQTEGLYILPTDAPVGAEIADYLHLNDTVMELELTPNRSDALNYRGVVYEIAAILGREVKMQEEFKAPHLTPTPVTVKIESDNCTKYSALVVKGLTVAESPLWLQAKLLAVGVRPINNIVDVTNFVMFELGQPLHAFDLSKVADDTIIVRQAQDGETHVTLDGVERKLDSSMLVIADPEKVIGLAGVMGGENSEVDSNTTTIVLESAYFDPGTTRKTGKALGLFSEAQKRFEKGMIDQGMVTNSLLRAALLIAELAGGEVVGSPVEVVKQGAEPQVLDIALERVNNYLGTSISEGEMVEILTRLGFEVSGFKVDGAHRVTVPTRRPDITRDVDLIEEIARIYGYDKIPATLPQGQLIRGGLSHEQRLRRHVRELLINSGLTEVITYTFQSPAALDRLGLADDEQLSNRLALMHPMSEERSVLRTHMLPSLLEVVEYNRNRKANDLALFEVGRVFFPDADAAQLPTERTRISGIFTGNFSAVGIGEKPRPVDFFTVKGVVENVLAGLGIDGVTYSAVEMASMHPGRTADIWKGDLFLGYVGALHPEVEEACDLPPTYYFQLHLETLLEARVGREVTVAPLPKFPAMERDIAVLVDVHIPAGHMLGTIRSAAGDLLESARVFDFYQGPQVPAGKKSLAFGLVYRSPERTLTDEEVTERHNRVQEALQEGYGAELRA
ncbi:phenylalanine--tRNA ligase subunit beta [Tumebacillus sp. ITR2]|uniref:Phenylalanine--tRNA ligase beta subunit n=1 Tax=Tumebacillus amylolyticus TaxID=2801339 RepID=A0ABS1J7V8_9BACL|nr:phenylalanine--tRNA ligase subunit beta [Tumebacillus amylolyticus]MBL0386356.1 phenylalanine--tRNA ligase subunit beta [Tumebacillus amylolyticus]